MNDKYDKKAIVSYLLPSIEHAWFEAFVSMILFLRQMSKELYEQNEMVWVDEQGKPKVVADVGETNSSSNDRLKRTIDQILPSIDEMKTYDDWCRYYHSQFVNYMASNYTEICDIVDRKYPPEVDLAIWVHDVMLVEKGKSVEPEVLKKQFVQGDYPFPLHAIPMDSFVLLQWFKNIGKYCDRDITEFLDDQAKDVYELENVEPTTRAKRAVEGTTENTNKYAELIDKFEKFRLKGETEEVKKENP